MATRRSSPARTASARESRMINLAMEQAEKQLREGTASPLVLSHFLKLGTAKYEYEKQKLEADTKLAMAKAQYMESQRNSEELAAAALKAFKSYTGVSDYDEEYYDD